MKAVRVRIGTLLVAAVLLAAGAGPGLAQSISASSYPLTVSGGLALEDMQSGTAQLLGPNLDDNASAVTTIGFDFWLAGSRYTQFSVNANGLLRLGGTVVNGAFSNDLANGSNAPQVTAYWDDIFVGTNGRVHSRVVGTAPNRKLVVEWSNMQVPRVGAGNTGAATFQCWLSETTGRIDFVYGSGLAANGLNGGASIGFGSSATAFASVTAASATVAYGTANNANVGTIASGTRYGFAPPRPAAPTNLTFSGVSATTATVHWTDAAMNETGYLVFRSIDGVGETLVAQLPANSTALPQSGLVPLTNYVWTVVALNEGALSNPLTGAQPTLAPGVIATTGSGNWSSTVPDAPWPGGVLPTPSDDVRIADGHDVVLDTNGSCYALTVGEGASGTLTFEATTARTLAVGGSVTIRPNAALRTPGTGTQTGHILSVGAGLTNDGTLDLSTAGDLAGGRLTFTGGPDATFDGSGPTTDLRTLTINKGSTADPVLTMAPAQLTIQGRAAGAGPFLTLTNGTLRFAGTFAMSDSVFATPAYQVPATAGLWLDNPNLVVLAQGGSPTIVGRLRVSAGTLNVGLAADQSLGLASGSSARIEGGEVRVAGRFTVTSATAIASYVQSGGTLTAGIVGNGSTTLASFDLGTAAGTSATMTGGNIVLQSAGTSGVGPRDFRNRGGIQAITGGGLKLGNASSGAAQTFVLSGTAPGVELTNTSAAHQAILFAATTAVGTSTLQAGTTLNLNGFKWTQSEGDLVNQGRVTGSLAGSELQFLGTATPQTYSGAGIVTAPLRGNGLTIENPAGVTIDPGVPQNLTTLRVNLVRGVLHNSARVTLGDTSAVATTQVGTTGLLAAGGAYDTFPTIHPLASSVAVTYLQESAARTTGFEIPASRTLSSLTINNSSGVTLAGGNLTVTTTAAFTSGVVTTSTGNVLTFANSMSTTPNGSSVSHVDGPLAITFAVSSATSRIYAIGTGGMYRPLILKSVNTGGVSRTFTARVLAGPTGGTVSPPLQSLTSAHSWQIANSAQLNAAARVNLAFGPDDNIGTLANARVAQAATPAGTYGNLGATTSGTSSAGTVESTLNLTPGSDAFAIASTGALAATWDGGAGTDNWGDAANWNPDGVPAASATVSLALPAPHAIVVNGTFTVATLTIGNNANVAVGSGTLNVTGNYNQSGSAVDLGTGTLTVGGTPGFFGGTFAVGGGTFSATGAVSIGGGAITVGSGGRFQAASAWTLSGGSFALGAGTLDVAGSFLRNAGTFDSGTGTTILSGTALQTVGGSLTFYDLLLRNGGASKPKRFTGASVYTINGDLTVESTAQIGVSSSDPTDVYLWGDFAYLGVAGGSNAGAFKLHLEGSGRTISGDPAPAALVQLASATGPVVRPEPESTVEVDYLTDPTKAARSGETHGGKPAIVLENTRARRGPDVERILHGAPANARVVINLDDVTLVRNPRSWSGLSGSDANAPGMLAAGPAEFPMPVLVETGASYTLAGPASIAAGQTLTVLGRLECGTTTIGGAGGLAAFSPGTIATSAAAGLGATVVTTGTNTYGDGAIIEYGAPGNQTISAAAHPSAALIKTAGGGTKTLSADETITGSSGSPLTGGALFVGAGTTFNDGGRRLSFTTPEFANVIVQGTYQSSGAGGLSYEAGPFESSILAPDGTVFGNLALNFGSSAYTIGLNTVGTGELTFRDIVLGGTAGTGNAGGTLRLSQSGTTNVTVTGTVAIAPADSSRSGGGFAGTAGRPSRVRLRGNLASTSTAPTLPLFDGVAGDRLLWAGTTPETLATAADAMLLSAGSFELANPAGLELVGAGRTMRLGAGTTLGLADAQLVTGSNTLSLGAGSTVTRTTGRVVGRLEKTIDPGPASATFEIGTPAFDTPVDLSFGNVTASGTVAAATAAGDAPNLTASGLDSTKSLNRTFSLAGTGVVFDSCAATFHFPAGDVDAGADPAQFRVRRYVDPTWSSIASGVRTATSTEARNVTGFGTFAIGEGRTFAIVTSAGPHGAVTPAGTTTVISGDGLVCTVVPDPGYHVADLKVDGVSVGAVTSHVFTDIQSDHLVEATFAVDLFTIVASAGPHGAISPVGDVVVAYGDDQVFAFTPDPNYGVADVLVDGVSQGAIPAYTFASVSAPHTIAVTFTAATIVRAAAAPGPISITDSCRTVPITIERVTGTPVRGFSVSFTLSPELVLCAGTSSIVEGTFLSSSGMTNFQVTDRGGGSYTADGVILGSGCGPTALTGTLFTLALQATVPQGTGAIAITDLKLRDCVNTPLLVAAGPSASVAIDRVAPTITVLSPNGAEAWAVGTTHPITWTASDAAGIAAVDLAYSTDSGATFPHAIAAGQANTGTFDWVVPATTGTAVRVRATAHDSSGNATADASDADFEIREANVAPVLAAIGDVTVDEGQPVALVAQGTDANLPAQALSYSLVEPFPAGSAIHPSTGAFSWTPAEAQGPGDHSITVRVTDDGVPVLFAERTFVVHVAEVNVAPVLADVPDSASIAENVAYAFTATATDADLPAQPLAFSLVGAPAGAAIGGSSGAFSWTPSEAQGPGTYEFAVRVSDGIATTERPIVLHVGETDAAPVLAGVPASASIPEGAEYAFTASGTDADLPAQSLAYSLVGAPPGAAIEPSSGVFTWTPAESQGPGDYVFQVRVVEDGPSPLDALQPIAIHVTEVNMPPLLIGVPAVATIAELVAFGFGASAVDPDLPAQPLTYSLVGAPSGAAIGGSSGAFAWTPGETQGPGSYGFSVRVSDGVDATDAPIVVGVTEANTPPVLDAIGDRSGPEGSDLTFTAAATDGDLPAQALVYTLDSGAPSGASIDPSTGVFHWTPAEADGPGSYPVTVRVTDDGTPALDDSETITLTISEANNAPVIADVPASATIPELAAYAFTATATDSDVPAQTLAFSLVGAPSGASIGGSSGAFTWTPSEAQGPGVYPFTVRVSDGTANSDAAITLTVTEANLAPVIADVPASATIPELAAYAFTATATDADLPAQALTFSLVGAPAGASIGGSSGAFSWTPSEAQGPGVYPFTVRVSDGTVNSDAAIALTVTEANAAPVIADVPASATIPELAAYAFTATATDADVPAQSLTFSLVGAPAGASIGGSSGAFSWTPSEAQGPGVYPFTVRVSDGTANSDAAITLTVTEANLAPVIADVPAAATIPELAAYAFTATAGDVDLPAQALTFSLVGAPAGASIGGSSGAFSWTPSEAQGPGVYPFTVRVSDGTANSDAAITLTVTEANTAPVIADVPASATIPEQAAYAFTATASDADLPAQSLTFSLVGAPAGASIGGSSGAFSWTPSEAQGPGVYPFTVRVSDGTANSDAAITLTVTEANAAPVIANVPASAAIPELASYGFTATATDADVPTQTLTFSLVGAPSGASIDGSSGAFSWTPSEAQGPGVYPFTVRVSDGTANSDASIALTVTEANTAPVIADVPASATIPELAAYAFTATASDGDLPAQTLTFSLVGAPAGASIGGSSGAFSWTPSEAQGPGVYPFTVRVSDGTANSDAAITLTVTEANAAPVIANVPAAATIPELAAYAFTASATDADLPAQSLTFSLAGAPSGASIDGSSGAFSWTPSEAQGPGVYPFTVRVSDGTANSDAAISLTVTEANTAPVIADVPASATIPELAAYEFTATATDADVPAQALTFSLVGAPAGASIGGASGAFSWTPSEAQGPGVYPFTVRVSDGTANSDASITLTVTEGNAPPVIADVPSAATIPELAAYAFTATATDPDLPAQTLTFSLVGAPAGASIGGSSGAFSWTPSEAQGPGAYPFTVRVSDGVTNSDAAITLTVTEANSAPLIANVPSSATIPELVASAFTATATDADVPAQTLTFSLVGAPAGASIDGSSGAFSWTPSEAQGPGVYPFTVRVSDGTANSDAAISLTVTDANAPPAIADVPAAATIPELAAYAFTATATDPDLPAQPLTFSLVGAPSGASIDGSSGAFSWTPSEAQGPGVYAFTVRVSDGIAQADAAIELTVAEVNAEPVLSGVPAAATIPELVASTFTTSATDADIPAQGLTFSLVGAPAGASIGSSSGAFTWTPSEAQGPGVYAFAVRVSDGVANVDAPITLTVSEVSIAAISDLVATPVKVGNDADGTTKIELAWTATPLGTTVEIYRAPFGGYPAYDDAGGSVPAVPTYPPGPPWVATALSAPGTDEPSARDFYYYVAFVKGAGDNVSGASNRTSGTLGYLLGDVSNMVTPGTGDNVVDTADLSLLGAHYGLSGAAVAPFAYLDVGPTTDLSADARPTTDQAIDFEDLLLFAIEFDAAAAPGPAVRTPAAASDAPDELSVASASAVVPGTTIPATLTFRGGGHVQGLSVRLSWDPAIVRPVSASAGALVTSAGGMLLTPRAGTVDVALLGARAVGLDGEGVLAEVSFETIGSGDPRIRIASVVARDAGNHDVSVAFAPTVDVAATPTRVAIARAVPNPFRGATSIGFELAHRGAVDLGVYAVNGRRIRTLVREVREAGVFRIAWDGRDDHGSVVPAGAYFVRLAAEGRVERESVIRLK